LLPQSHEANNANYFFRYKFTSVKKNTLRLYDSRGILLKEEQNVSWPFTLHRNNTPAGFYFYTISSQKEAISTGKLVME
jgi:hypothetical protein